MQHFKNGSNLGFLIWYRLLKMLKINYRMSLNEVDSPPISKGGNLQIRSGLFKNPKRKYEAPPPSEWGGLLHSLTSGKVHDFFMVPSPITKSVKNWSRCLKSIKIKVFVQSSALLNTYLLSEYFPKNSSDGSQNPLIEGEGGKLSWHLLYDH